MENKELERTPCLVYSRVCGYYSPTNQWNDASKAGYSHRKTFDVKLDCDECL